MPAEHLVNDALQKDSRLPEWALYVSSQDGFRTSAYEAWLHGNVRLPTKGGINDGGIGDGIIDGEAHTKEDSFPNLQFSAGRIGEIWWGGAHGGARWRIFVCGGARGGASGVLALPPFLRPRMNLSHVPRPAYESK